MTQEFHIKGISGLLVFMAIALLTFIVLFFPPSVFTMVLWNATVFEGFHGPEIGFTQAFLLWSAIIVLYKMIFNPKFKMIEFRQTRDPEDRHSMPDFKNSKHD